ncbi:HIT family protein [Candidatus Uhrbacteria bacterium]|nr:HIT family protein [Candidatus Uhrbacteria bacterium]
MSDCLFCKIISKDLPADIVYEDDKVIAILDIHPVNPGHTLVMPKAHTVQLLDASEETVRELMAATRKIAEAITKGLETDAFNLEMNCGPVAGQVIPHLHLHIVPRYAEDGLKHWPGKSYAEGEAATVAEKIKNSL